MTTIGPLLKDWRQRRRISQLDLALEAEISQRHLSFVESGRSRPSREMVLRLAERLAVPLRARNALLVAAGHAPEYAERGIADPSLAPAMEAVRMILDGHGPWPALAVDRHWNLLAANRMAMRLMEGVDASLLGPPVNVLRASLHPGGLAPRIANLRAWKTHVMDRLKRDADASADAGLEALLAEIARYPAGAGAAPDAADRERAMIATPLRLRVPGGELAFISTTTVFGTATDVTLAEITLETFFPADGETAAALRAMAAA
ncbi:helix-turn-helix transcriptional regulator [Roseomonas terrae]|jgi:transcriptional regulator with XRE-family HTH domain|uniref:Helix-turn-helix transcriptional regulator n=1 Tax=Neoroseomonas terrae TaxID=424799 RepID=A0ABS5EBD4_9PROT|nr:helix-turn-helix transcriptional regulator [Neoroseomonas terrae]MBR0648316.1 helix-turn-helix transcriptional regulator [Neoroseomonas terrae]